MALHPATFRDATADDAAELADVFADAVRSAGPLRYTPQQVEAWAAAADDPASFGARVLAHRTLVAVAESEVVGFASVAPDGHIHTLYVRGRRQGGGLGARLLSVALDAATEAGASRAYAEASSLGLPAFTRAGFTETGVESVDVRGVTFERHLVEKTLRAGPRL